MQRSRWHTSHQVRKRSTSIWKVQVCWCVVVVFWWQDCTWNVYYIMDIAKVHSRYGVCESLALSSSITSKEGERETWISVEVLGKESSGDLLQHMRHPVVKGVILSQWMMKRFKGARINLVKRWCGWKRKKNRWPWIANTSGRMCVDLFSISVV